MASVKIVLRNEKKADGLFPLAIRVTKDRKSSYQYLEYRIAQRDWDEKAQRVKKSNPNSVRLNNFLAQKLAEFSDLSLELETSKKHVSANAVTKKARRDAGSTFFAQARLYLERLKADGKYNRYTPDKSRLERFMEYLKHDQAFQDISIPMIERFKAYVRAGLGQSERSAVNHLVVIRSVFSQAISEGIIDERYYPFGKGRIAIKFPDSKKIGLNRQEITQLEKAELEGKADHARNLWLFSYYFAGMRVSDVLRLHWTDFQDNRLHYSMGKNNKAGSLKIPMQAQKILEQYASFRDNADDLIFPELKGQDLSDRFITERTIAFKTSAIDKVLKEQVAPAANIKKTFTMHIARHSFAQIAGGDIAPQMLQQLYRHSDLKTTIGYQSNFTHTDADNALDSVLNGLKPTATKKAVGRKRRQPE